MEQTERRITSANTGFTSGWVTCKLGTLCSETRPNAKPETVGGNPRYKNIIEYRVLTIKNMTADNQALMWSSVGILKESLTNKIKFDVC